MDFSRELIRLYDRILEIAPVYQREALKGMKDRALIGQFVAGARGQSTRLELRRLDLENPTKSFSEIRDLALEMFRDVERVPKVKTSHVRHVQSEFEQEFGEDVQPTLDQQEACVNGLATRTERGESKWQLQQDKMLKSIQDIQGQLAKQQEQITSLTGCVLKLCTSDRDSNGLVGKQTRGVNRGPPRCFECKQLGHFRAQCPLNSGNGNSCQTSVSLPNQNKNEGGLN